MTLREKLKSAFKSSPPSKPPEKPTPKDPRTDDPTIREKSKLYHNMLKGFEYGTSERRKSSQGGVSPLGSRRGSVASIRRLSLFRRSSSDRKESDALPSKEVSKKRTSLDKARKSSDGRPGPFNRPHSGDPKALEPIMSVAEPDPTLGEQEPKITYDGLPGTSAAVKSSTAPIAESKSAEAAAEGETVVPTESSPAVDKMPANGALPVAPVVAAQS